MKKIAILAICALTAYADENIGHECGLALIRLRKPLHYYEQVYGDAAWGARKLCILIEEQRNRGQDGAGIAVMKFDMPPGELYLRRIRNAEPNAIDQLLTTFSSQLPTSSGITNAMTDKALKRTYEFLGEIYLGHVRYGTHSGNNLRCCQPFICKNSVASKNFALAGNFNMTNSRELCQQLVDLGLMPTSESDTQVILELISYCLKQEHITLAPEFDYHKGKERADLIAKEINMANVLRNACQSWDGGYVFAGILGNGDAFICRDPAGIRPGYFYCNEEVFAAASERTALMNAFTIKPNQIEEIKPGHVVVIKRDGLCTQQPFTACLPIRQCSFERIYFSKATDPSIYEERKKLGKNVATRVLAALGQDIENAIFSYVPNSGETAFLGLIEELNKIRFTQQLPPVRIEKLLHKNQRLRTFITNDHERNNLVSRLYTVTHDVVQSTNTLVVIDDSIVRGTTLRESIIKELANLNPKRIIFISSAPPVLYPDCYGIDMSQIGKFIAFQAAIKLLKKSGQESLLEEIKNNCLAQQNVSHHTIINHLQELYSLWTLEELSAEIAQLVRPVGLSWNGDIQIIYQSIEGLQSAMPDYTGDWYFTGNYPTSGGYQVLNTSYLQWCQGSQARAY